MAHVSKFSSSFGMSLDIKGVWHKFNVGIEISLDEGDDVAKAKQMAHNTVQQEVEKQIDEAIASYSDTTDKP